jgi:hypothetical protein
MAEDFDYDITEASDQDFRLREALARILTGEDF